MTDSTIDHGPDEPSGSAGQRAYEGYKRALKPAKAVSMIPRVGKVLTFGVLATGIISGALSAKKPTGSTEAIPGCPNCGGTWRHKRGITRDFHQCENCKFSCDSPGLAQAISTFTRDFAAAARADATKQAQRRS